MCIPSQNLIMSLVSLNGIPRNKAKNKARTKSPCQKLGIINDIMIVAEILYK